MSTQYLEITLASEPAQRELVIASLYSLEYEAFWETDEGVVAYVDETLFSREELIGSLEQLGLDEAVIKGLRQCEDINWNKAWEENFTEAEITDNLIVRASFHKPEKDYEHEIIVDPQMSFGTGHHATTSMVLQFQLDLDHKDKHVLDVGCGTGILGIMAEKLGAGSVVGCDIDQWSLGNTESNFALNNCQKSKVYQGTIEDIPHKHEKYGIILANINKNVLLKDMKLLEKYLSENGYLVLSGFYQEDVKDLTLEAEKVGLSVKDSKTRDRWVSLLVTR